MSTLRESLYTFMTISKWIPLRMGSISGRIYKENQNTHFIFNNFFFKENHALCETVWRNMEELATSRMRIRRMCFACWITNATDSQSKYPIPTDFPHQQLLLHHTSVLCFTHTACCVTLCSHRRQICFAVSSLMTISVRFPVSFKTTKTQLIIFCAHYLSRFCHSCWL